MKKVSQSASGKYSVVVSNNNLLILSKDSHPLMISPTNRRSISVYWSKNEDIAIINNADSNSGDYLTVLQRYNKQWHIERPSNSPNLKKIIRKIEKKHLISFEKYKIYSHGFSDNGIACNLWIRYSYQKQSNDINCSFHVNINQIKDFPSESILLRIVNKSFRNHSFV